MYLNLVQFLAIAVTALSVILRSPSQRSAIYTRGGTKEGKNGYVRIDMTQMQVMQVFPNLANLVQTLVRQPRTFRQDQVSNLWHKLDDPRDR